MGLPPLESLRIDNPESALRHEGIDRDQGLGVPAHPWSPPPCLDPFKVVRIGSVERWCGEVVGLVVECAMGWVV